MVVIFNQSGLEMGYPLMETTLDGEENGSFLRRSKRAKSPLPFFSFSFYKEGENQPKKGPYKFEWS